MRKYIQIISHSLFDRIKETSLQKEIIPGKNGYDIPCLNNINGDETMVVIVSHGFGSSKDSASAPRVADTLPKHGIATFGFDFPAHGESPVDGDSLRIENCLNDLASVERHVHGLLPDAKIAYFSSSFGAYINLIYLATRPHLGVKSFLRCAAVAMPGIFRDETTAQQAKELEQKGFVTIDYDYFRPLKITKAFRDDLNTHDVFSLFQKGATEMMMISCTADQTASIDDRVVFAARLIFVD
jgi:pimeloyl-ACP methyl ester carboxylesterase